MRESRRDAFLVEIDEANRDGRNPLSREGVYAGMLEKALSPVGTVAATRLAGWRRSLFARKDGQGIPREKGADFPVVDGVAEITVGDPSALASLIAAGFGRGKAYGLGMVLIRPSAYA